MDDVNPPNRAILDEVNTLGSWLHARKVGTIWAKVLEQDQSVRTREGWESVRAGDFLCRGEASDIWPQSSTALQAKYDRTNEVDEDGWRKYLPKRDDDGVLAAQVPHTFVIRTTWGTLQGRPGDYVVKKYADKDTAYPADVWIVGCELFASTYAQVPCSD